MAVASSSGNSAAITTPQVGTSPLLVLQSLQPSLGVSDILLRPGRYFLGSDANCEVHLTAPGIAPQHALILAGPQKTIIRTCDRRTWLNEGPVATSTLNDGDRLQIGPAMFRVRRIDIPADAEVLSPTREDLASTAQDPRGSTTVPHLSRFPSDNPRREEPGVASQPEQSDPTTSSLKTFALPIPPRQNIDSQPISDQLRDVLEVAVRAGIAPRETLHSPQGRTSSSPLSAVDEESSSLATPSDTTSHVPEPLVPPSQESGELQPPERGDKKSPSSTPALPLADRSEDPRSVAESDESVLSLKKRSEVDDLEARLHAAESLLLRLQHAADQQQVEIEELEALVEESRRQLLESERRRHDFEQESRSRESDLEQREQDLIEWETILKDREEDFRIRQSAHEAREADVLRHHSSRQQDEARIAARQQALEASLAAHEASIAGFEEQQQAFREACQQHDQQLSARLNQLEATEREVAKQRELLEVAELRVADEQQQRIDELARLEHDRAELERKHEALTAATAQLQVDAENLAVEQSTLATAQSLLMAGQAFLKGEQSEWNATRGQRDQECKEWETQRNAWESERLQIEQAARELARNRAEFGKQSQALDIVRLELEETAQRQERRARRVHEEAAQLERAEAGIERQRHELALREDQYELDRQQLIREKQRLAMDYLEIETARCSLANEHEQLAAARAGLHSEREKLEATSSQLKASTDQLSEQRRDVDNLHQEAVTRRAELDKDHLQIVAERAELEVHRTMLARERAAFDAELAALRGKLVSYDSQSAELQELRAKQELAAELLERERVSFLCERTALAQDRAALQSERNAFFLEQMQLEEGRRILDAELARGISLRQQLSAERESLLRQQEECQAREETLRQRESDRTSDQAELEAERRDRIRERDSWLEERAEILHLNELAQQERADHLASVATLTTECNRLKAELESTNRSVDAVDPAHLAQRQQCDALLADNAALQAEQQRLREQREEWAAQHAMLQAERNDLAGERDSLRSELESRQQAQDLATDHERTALQSVMEQSRIAIDLERDAVARARTEMECERNSLAAEQQSFSAEKDQFAAERHESQNQQTKLDADREALAAARSVVQHARETIETQRASMQHNRNQMDQREQELARREAELQEREHQLNVRAERLTSTPAVKHAVDKSRDSASVMPASQLRTDAAVELPTGPESAAAEPMSGQSRVDDLRMANEEATTSTSESPLGVESNAPTMLAHEERNKLAQAGVAPPVSETAAGEEPSLLAGFFRKKESRNQVDSLRSQLAQMFDLPGKKSNQESAHEVPDAERYAEESVTSSHRPETAMPPESTETSAAAESSLPAASSGIQTRSRDVAAPHRQGSYLPSQPPDESTEAASTTTSGDGVDESSISAYMEKLLARSRRSSEERDPSQVDRSDSSSGQSRRESRQIPIDPPPRRGETSTRSNRGTQDHDPYRDSGSLPLDPHSIPTSSISTDTIPLPPDPVHRQDKMAVKADLVSLRQIANLSARSAIVTSTWRRMRVRIAVTALLTTLALILALLMLTSKFWASSSYAGSGWAALLVACVSGFELAKTALLLHRMSSRRNESLDGDVLANLGSSDRIREKSETSSGDSTSPLSPRQKSQTREASLPREQIIQNESPTTDVAPPVPEPVSPLVPTESAETTAADATASAERNGDLPTQS